MNGLNGTDEYDPRIAWREGFESIDAATLLDKPLPKSKFLVDGLIPQGVHLIDVSAQNFDTVLFSGGKIGYQVELPPSELLKVVRCTYADLTKTGNAKD